jgi:bifunctional non-homologous end joining protein LigD
LNAPTADRDEHDGTMRTNQNIHRGHRGLVAMVVRASSPCRRLTELMTASHDTNMALEKYRQKRNFKSTPEPAGDPTLVAQRAERAKKARPGKGLFFCVQKHLASHLHYDLRLEHNGVLLSWAVPKGPSLDPKTKRLAMHVEDHPIEYGTFEGVIPEGYGAGIVMLWDQGTWTPQTDDVDAALAKGDLKFTLDGYKLKGSWVLVRTGGRYGGNDNARSWLLIKHRDEWAGELDIAEFASRSVKSDGEFEDILAADEPDIWVTNRPAKGGETGAMLAAIIKKAAALKSQRGAVRETPGPAAAPPNSPGKETTAARTSKTTTRKPRSIS